MWQIGMIIVTLAWPFSIYTGKDEPKYIDTVLKKRKLPQKIRHPQKEKKFKKKTTSKRRQLPKEDALNKEHDLNK